MDAADVEATAAWVTARGFRRVALQFPDEHLAGAVASTAALQAACGEAVSIFLLADTTFGSCCVDEVAALHADADCVVHFGRSCLSPVSRLPSRLVYAKQPLDVAHLAARLADHARECAQRAAILVLLDQEHVHASTALQAAIRTHDGAPLVFGDAPPTELEPPAGSACGASAPPQHCCGGGGCAARQPAELQPCAAAGSSAPRTTADDLACGVTWQLPPGVALSDCCVVWVGDANALLLRLLMSLPLLPDGSAVPCARYDPATRGWESQASQAGEAQRVLKRRYYLVERARQAVIVGLVAGTLGVAGYQGALERVQRLADAAGKKTYTLLVGKPNPAKLANFPEVEVFVLVACPQTALLDSRDFMAPIITVFEAELAFTPGATWTPGEYRTSFPDAPLPAIQTLQRQEADAERSSDDASDADGEDSAPSSSSQQLILQGDRAVRASGGVAQVTTAAEFLTLRRTYQGLVPVTREGGDTEPAAGAAQGQSGRAATYRGEGVA